MTDYVLLDAELPVFPSAALPASGSMGMISARYVKAPLSDGKSK